MKAKWNEFYVLPNNFRILGIVLFCFVFLNNKSKLLNTEDVGTLLNHERIHVRQQLELLILPFFILYLTEWLFLLLKYKNKDQAYRNISFEREAYDKANNLNYLKERKPYVWLHYWRKSL